MEINKNVSLRDLNTFGLDVNAAYLTAVKNEQDLKPVLTDKFRDSMPTMILGGGSNILFSEDYQGLVIKNDIHGREVIRQDDQHVWVRLGAGENWHQVVLWAIENGWAGIENLSLIPGTVGAAPMQNIGAYGVELSSVFEHLEAIELSTAKSRKFEISDCDFGYRYSVFKGPLKDQFVITRVTLKLNKKPVFNISYGAVAQTLEKNGS